VAVAIFYVVLCAAASFFPEANFFLPVISRGISGKKNVALPFDDGPADPTTKQVLELLDKYSMKATFFVTGVNAALHPAIIKDIIGRGHAIGNHSLNHNPFLMLKSNDTIYREISETQEILRKTGIIAKTFRPPVGIVNPKLGPILNKLEMSCVTFSLRAGDAGNRFIENISSKILNKIRADDIILLHDARPQSTVKELIFLREIDNLLAGIIARGFCVVPLSQLIGREICQLKKEG